MLCSDCSDTVRTNLSDTVGRYFSDTVGRYYSDRREDRDGFVDVRPVDLAGVADREQIIQSMTGRISPWVTAEITSGRRHAITAVISSLPYG